MKNCSGEETEQMDPNSPRPPPPVAYPKSLPWSYTSEEQLPKAAFSCLPQIHSSQESHCMNATPTPV